MIYGSGGTRARHPLRWLGIQSAEESPKELRIPRSIYAPFSVAVCFYGARYHVAMWRD